MIILRDMNSSPPHVKTKVQNNPTLLVSWWCTGFALAIIIVRLAGRYVRTEKLFREDKIMAWSMIPLLARMGLVHLVLIWGTNNFNTADLTPLQMQQQMQHREIGSKLVLASRIMYAAFLWIAKFTISEFLKRLTDQVWKRSYEVMLQIIRWFLVVTFIAVVIATLAECRPFHGYWQVIPDPGPMCRQGYAQLITMGASDVITDLLLVCFPIPIVMKSAMVLKRKISLILLFGLSLILIGITIYRVIAVIDRHSDQQFRSLLASLEILAAAAVSNALVLGSFVRDRGAKKQRFKFGSVAGTSSLDRASVPRQNTLTARNWGSDADLVGDLGMRLEPELSAEEATFPRPAPIALPLASQARNVTPNVTSSWAFPKRTSVETDETDGKSCLPDNAPSPAEISIITPRRMSFFDVGGLLDDDATTMLPRYPAHFDSRIPQSTSTPRLAPHTEVEEFTVHHSNQGGSNALLRDIGGLLSGPGAPPQTRSPTTNFSRPSITQSPGTRHGTSQNQNSSSNSLRDVGGLLS